MTNTKLLLFITSLCNAGSFGHDLNVFDDTILYKIEWPRNTDAFLEPQGSEPMVVTTANKEKYKCLVPSLGSQGSEDKPQYSGPAPLELLSPLFSQVACSYRLESYWTYELCHGKYVKQYHEEREGKKVKSQEYFLGKWDKKQKEEAFSKITSDKEIDKLKMTKIDGMSLPYVEVVMTDGTVCDLNNKPRLTRVLYVCYASGKHEVYSLKETSTCEYEMIVLSPLLCSHPLYKPQESGEHLISCLALDGASRKPQSMLRMELDSMKLKQQRISESKMAKDVVAVFKVEKQKDGESRVQIEIVPVDLDDKSSKKEISRQLPEGPKDYSPVEAFLSGKNCLTGGSGWWKYEFCYGRSVEQFHLEPDGRKTSVQLGNFYKPAHLKWLELNPHKRPKSPEQRIQLSHFYSGGSACEKTGKLRQTEVKLKCLENSSSPGAVSLYLLEPKTCEYILGVESPLICDILLRADDNGLVQNPDDSVTHDSSESPKEIKAKSKSSYSDDYEIKFEND